MHPRFQVKCFVCLPVQQRLWSLRHESADSAALFVFPSERLKLDRSRLRHALRSRSFQARNPAHPLLSAARHGCPDAGSSRRESELQEADLPQHIASPEQGLRVAWIPPSALRNRATAIDALAPYEAQLLLLDDRSQLLLLALPSLCADSATGAVLLRDLSPAPTVSSNDKTPLQTRRSGGCTSSRVSLKAAKGAELRVCPTARLLWVGDASACRSGARHRSGATSGAKRILPAALVRRIDAVAPEH